MREVGVTEIVSRQGRREGGGRKGGRERKEGRKDKVKEGRRK